jgi:MFS transporter, CP family, cyanate transporter
MKDTAAPSTGPGDGYDAIVTNGSVTAIRDVEITHEKSAGARKAAWLVVAIVVIAIALRPGIASIGPVLPLISREFSLSHATASLLTTIPTLLMGLLALPTPWLARRFGRNGVLLASLVLLFVSMAARAFAPNVSVLLLTTAGVGAGIATSGTLFAGIIKARFPTKGGDDDEHLSQAKNNATSHAVRFVSGNRAALAALVVAAASSRLSHTRIASAAKIAISATGLQIPVPIRHPFDPFAPANAAIGPVAAAETVVLNASEVALLSWTSPIYLEQGLSAASAGLVVATYTVAFTVAIPMFGSLSQAHDRRGWLAACAALAGAGTLGLALAPLLMPHVWIGIAAFGLGGGFTLGMTLPLDSVHSADDVNTWNAFVMTVGYLIAAAGPLLVGSLRDVTGTFRAPIWLLFIVALGMLVLTPFLAPRQFSN